MKFQDLYELVRQNLSMLQLAGVCMLISAIIPPSIHRIGNRFIQKAVVLLYCFGIIHLTIGMRLIAIAIGSKPFDPIGNINLTPFWSYAKFDQADIRWQIYLNVFLFVPFGFMLPWCSERLQRLWKVVLIAAAFSALTEAAQYFLRIGLCETDDVIHNTLGAGLGYGYWRLLSFVQGRITAARGKR